MPAAVKPSILRYLYRTEFGPGVLSFSTLLAEAARVALGVDGPDVDSFVEANAHTCWNYLFKHEAANLNRGVSPVFSVVDARDRLLEWCASDATRGNRRQSFLKHRPAMLRAIDNITEREYEMLGCVIIELIGATRIHLTPRGKEGGVDFFAMIITPSPCHVFLGNTSPMRIVGQCKKYSSPVEHDKVKAFTDTIQDICRQSPRVEAHVPNWFRATTGPIVGWIVAHSGLQSGAASRARDHGIIYSDSLDLAEILALSRRLRQDLSPNGRVSELRRRIIELASRFPA